MPDEPVAKTPGAPAVSNDTSDGQVTDKAAASPVRSHPYEPALLWVYPEPRITPIRSGTTRIGRRGNTHIVLEDTLVSRAHAELQRHGERTELVDLGSKNGVYLGGVRCQQAQLSAGDVLRIGNHVAIFVVSDAARRREFQELRPGVFGSFELARALSVVERVAKTALGVLIQGETGTGKEALARALHEQSGRKGAFVALNCGAFAESLLEAELFGHDEGAFTDAKKARLGRVLQANNGTLFLDEIADLATKAQSRLLRVIQEKEVTPLGDKPRPVDVRWVSATHRNLREAVREREFREDLFHRLVGVTIELPALRERREDIWPLFQLFVRQAGGDAVQIDATLVDALCSHSWPGNIRQLENVARSMLALVGSGTKWDHTHLPDELSPSEAVRGREPPGRVLVNRESLRGWLHADDFNVTALAERLGKSRTTIYKLLEQHDLMDELEEHRGKR